MKCETCNAETSGRARDCVEGHTHAICPACVLRYWRGYGEPIRCPDRGWDGTGEAAESPSTATEALPEEDEAPPF